MPLSSLTFEDDNYAEGVMRTLNNMRILGVGCDAVLSTEDGGMFRVHRSIMSRCSTYFRTVFTTSLVDINCGDGPQVRTFIVIPNVSSAMLEVIIQYAYSGVTLVSEDNVQTLLPAADQFNVQGIVKVCTDFLVNKMEPSNCLGIWRFGKEYFLFDLEKESFEYILEHFPEIATKSTEFLELSAPNLDIFLKEDSLNVDKEIDVWNAVKRWVQHNQITRLPYLPDLLSSIRLAVLPLNDFQCLIKDPMINKCIQCKPYVAQVARFFLRDLSFTLNSAGKLKQETFFIPRLPRSLIVCIGGWNQTGLTNPFEAYDCRADTWRKIELQEPTGPRVYHQCVSLGKYVYLMGGTGGFNPTNTCCRFHTETMKYEEVFSECCRIEWEDLRNGGYDGGDERSKTAECFVPENNQWTYIASMYSKRSDASACHLKSRIYVAGGFDGSAYLNSVEVYYIEFNQWYVLPQMNSCRSGLGVATVGDYIYAVGGCDGAKRLQSVEKYDITSKQWYSTKPMRRARSNFAIQVMENKIYVMGGYDNKSDTTYRSEPHIKQIYALVMENKIYVMGGYDDESDTTTDECECYNPCAPRWKRIAPLSIGRSGLSACVISGLKNVQDYTLDCTSRSAIMKHLSEDIVLTLGDLSLSNRNESQMTY